MANTSPPPRTFVPLLGAVAFLCVYLAAGPIADAVGQQPLPLPDAPVDEVYTYFTDSAAAAVVSGVLQLLSVAGLAVFVAVSSPRLPQGRIRTAFRSAGWIAVAAMTVSSLIAVMLGTSASALAPGTVVVWRDISFYSGGVVHVVTLGVLALTIALNLHWTRTVRVLSWVAAVPALLSVSSLAWYYAAVLLPVGRVLAMIAFITAAVSLARGRSLTAVDSSV